MVSPASGQLRETAAASPASNRLRETAPASPAPAPPRTPVVPASASPSVSTSACAAPASGSSSPASSSPPPRANAWGVHPGAFAGDARPDPFSASALGSSPRDSALFPPLGSAPRDAPPFGSLSRGDSQGSRRGLSTSRDGSLSCSAPRTAGSTPRDAAFPPLGSAPSGRRGGAAGRSGGATPTRASGGYASSLVGALGAPQSPATSQAWPDLGQSPAPPVRTWSAGWPLDQAPARSALTGALARGSTDAGANTLDGDASGVGGAPRPPAEAAGSSALGSPAETAAPGAPSAGPAPAASGTATGANDVSSAGVAIDAGGASGAGPASPDRDPAPAPAAPVLDSDGEGDAPTCAICLADVDQEDLALVPGCGHAFHAVCILRWVLARRRAASARRPGAPPPPPAAMAPDAPCPCCKAPFASLMAYRQLDGSLADFPVLESTALLVRARWFLQAAGEAEEEEAEARGPVVTSDLERRRLAALRAAAGARGAPSRTHGTGRARPGGFAAGGAPAAAPAGYVPGYHPGYIPGYGPSAGVAGSSRDLYVDDQAAIEAAIASSLQTMQREQSTREEEQTIATTAAAAAAAPAPAAGPNASASASFPTLPAAAAAAATPPSASASGSASRSTAASRFAARHLDDADDGAFAAADDDLYCDPFFFEGDDDGVDDDEFLYGARGGLRRVTLGNRRFGRGGVVSSGPRLARPAKTPGGKGAKGGKVTRGGTAEQSAWGTPKGRKGAGSSTAWDGREAADGNGDGDELFPGLGDPVEEPSSSATGAATPAASALSRLGGSSSPPSAIPIPASRASPASSHPGSYASSLGYQGGASPSSCSAFAGSSPGGGGGGPAGTLGRRARRAARREAADAARVL